MPVMCQDRSLRAPSPAKRLGIWLDVAFGDATGSPLRASRPESLRQTLLLPVRAGMVPPTRDRLPKPRTSRIFVSQHYARGTANTLIGD